MEANAKATNITIDKVSYYSNDFEWKELKEKYEEYLNLKNEIPSLVSEAKSDYSIEWETFYQQNSDNFFKDRKYLHKCFNEIKDECEKTKENLYLMEVGCGVGNTIFPLLKLGLPNLFIFGLDISNTAIEITQKNSLYTAERYLNIENFDKCGRVRTFVCDVKKDEILEIAEGKIDFCTMIFFLSAFMPNDLEGVVRKIDKKIKKDGLIFIRDYGLLDMSMIRNFKKKNELISENTFKKGDGIIAHYFSKEYLRKLFFGLGYEELENEYATIRSENKKREVIMERVFVTAKFKKK